MGELLGTKYNEYDITDLEDVNRYFQDIRKMDIDERNDVAEKIRKALLKKWDENSQPLGGGKKTDEQIIKDFKSLTTLNIDEILTSDFAGNRNVLKYFGKAPSGINQYFPEMLDTPISLGNKSISVMDVIKNEDSFRKFFESIVYKDRMYAFTMWYGSNSDNNFADKDFVIPIETRQLLDLPDGKIPIQYKSLENVEGDKKFDGFKIPFFLEKDSIYYKLDVDNSKKESDNFKKNHINNTELKPPQIRYNLSSFSSYHNNMRIFPNITQSFRLGGGSQPVSNFSAGIAHFLILNFFNENINLIENDTFVVLDSSTGWAGRLVGLLSCYTKMRDVYKEKKNKELNVVYLTTDPNEKINDRYEVIIEDWFKQIEPTVNKSYFKFRKSLYGSETVEFLEYCKSVLSEFNVNGCTMGLTSPPYFNREQYNKSDIDDKDGKNINQSWSKFDKYKDWSNEFLKPTIENINQLLIEDGVFYMNIANLNGGNFTLEDDTIKYGKGCGLSCSNDDKYKMLMATMTGNNKSGTGTGGQATNSVEISEKKLQKFEPIFKLKKIKLIPETKTIQYSEKKKPDWFNEL
jgi:hypothetical protein